MNGKELIMWILKHEAESAQFEVQYRDGGGDYSGTDETLYLIDENTNDNDGRSYRRVVL